MNRILLACSGSLSSSAAIPWLAETYGAEVVTVTLDIGQGAELAHVRERALAAGAIRAHVIDARDEFVRDYILPALRAGVSASRQAFAGLGLARPLIARRLVDVAGMENVSAVAHGCACDDEDRAAIEDAVRALRPDLPIIAPACEWHMSPAQLADYARARRIAVVPPSRDNVEVNLWGRTIYGQAADEDFRLTRSAADAPEGPAIMDLEFQDGVPIRTNGVDMSIIEMIESIETIAGTHGVGRIAIDAGCVAESPAAVVLQAACTHLAASAGPHAVSGSVQVRLFKGACEVIGVLEPKAAF